MVTRTVVVTGASGGVGRGIAHACGAAGWDVWIAARRPEAGNAVAREVDDRGGRGHFVACDVSRPRDVWDLVRQVVATSGALHGVVHNATSGESSQPAATTDVGLGELCDHVAVGLRALHSLARACHPHLARTAGSLVVTTSEAGFEGKAHLAAYGATKAAQRGLVQVLAREWGPDGIRVNAVAPLAATPAMTDFFERSPAARQKVLGRVPLGRLGDPADDIGPAVRFLLSDDARFVTGQTLMIDGGSCPIA